MVAAILLLAGVCATYVVLSGASPLEAGGISDEDVQGWMAETPEETARFFGQNNTFYGDTGTTRAFTWVTDRTIEASDVLLVPMAGEVPQWQNATVLSGESGALDEPLGLLWHRALAENLLPDTAYWYRVGDAGAEMWGKAGQFFTAPAEKDAFSFVCIADTHTNSTGNAALAAETLEYALGVAPDAAFIMHSGDVVDDGGEEDSWLLYLDANRSALLNYAIVPAAGNHDGYDHKAPYMFDRHFYLPQPNGQNIRFGTYYSFTYGQVHFITLNTNEKTDDYHWISRRQAEWLREDVEKARRNGAGRIVVNMHRGPYALSTHADEPRIEKMRDSVAVLLEELGVDFVIQGHDHYVSRTHALYDGNVSDTGTVYVNCGAAANKFYAFNDGLEDAYYALFSSYTSPERSEFRQSFMVVHVEADGGLYGTVYEIDKSKQNPVLVAVDDFALNEANPPRRAA